MPTPTELDAACKAARAWIDKEAGLYAGMISDADVQQLCQIVLAAAQQADAPPTQEPQS